MTRGRPKKDVPLRISRDALHACAPQTSRMAECVSQHMVTAVRPFRAVPTGLDAPAGRSDKLLYKVGGVLPSSASSFKAIILLPKI